MGDETKGTPTPDPVPRPGEVRWGDLRRLSPISRKWGYDRGRPVDRFYIERFLETWRADIRGNVLEIGDDSYTRRFGGPGVTTSDVLHVREGHPGATIVADLANAPHLPAERFDCVIFTQTLHLIFDARAALATLARILKPSGVLLATFPGLSQLDYGEWSSAWYWGFTSHSARALFGFEFAPERTLIEAHGNVLVTTAFLYGLAAEELAIEEFEAHDPAFETVLTVRAQKAAGPAPAVSASP